MPGGTLLLHLEDYRRGKTEMLAVTIRSHQQVSAEMMRAAIKLNRAAGPRRPQIHP
jgi:hypothetical protein